MENVIKGVRRLIWILAVFVLLGIYNEVQAVCGADTVTKNSINYGTVVGADGKCWLDRNLGATQVATSYNDSSAYGWYVQWGRGIDGHQLSTSMTTANLSSSDNPGHSNFITNSTSPYDWRSAKNDALWQGVSGTNNPCPVGWRIPTSAEWSTLSSAAGITNYTTAYNSSLKLTASGNRDSTSGGIISNQGSIGFYWGVSPSDLRAPSFRFTSSGIFPSNTSGRSIGLSVRCIRDASAIATATATTQTSSSITSINAAGNGNIISVGGENPTRYIEWGTIPGTYASSCSAGIGGVGAYSCIMTSLTPNTIYYVRAKAVNSGGISYGSQTSFTTSSTISISSVITQESTSINATAAAGNSTITATGGENPTRSIEWGTTSGTDYSNSCTADTGGAGAYSCAMTGLLPSTTYYVRAKATNSAGTAYGSETSFTTTAFVCGTDTVTRNSITYGTVVGADGNCWLDRNLGATRVANAYNDSAAYGWYFQWGRNDDGHQITTSGNIAALSSSDTPVNANFIKAPSYPWDWRSPRNNNLWQGVNGINNPCPSGWRLPTSTEWIAEVAAAGITNRTTAFNSSLKLTAAGNRNFSSASLTYQGSDGIYWSSSPSDALAFYFAFYSGGVNSALSDSRASGYSVRCIKDNPITTSILTTNVPSSITSITATGNATLSATGGNNPSAFIEWGTTQGSNYTNSCSPGTVGVGAYSCIMTNLTPGTTYYARAKATNSAGTSYGNEVSFTTLQAKASVTTNQISDIRTTQAIGNATITDIGGENPTREIQWGTQTNNYTNSCSALTGSTGAYSCNITGLQPATTYYAIAMATNSAGTSYGEETSFQTLPSQVTITDPDTTKMTNSVTSNYMSVNSGSITSTPQITTNTNVIIQDGIVKMDIPSNTQITKTDSGNFNFQNFIAESATNIVKQTIPNSISAVKIGVVGTKISFSQPITISIDVDSGYNGRTLDVLYQNDGETTWHSQTSCTITSGKCVFTTNHATTYSVNGSGNMAGETGINLNTDIQEVIALDCGATSINLGNITPGTPITGSSTCTATTNANGGYNLSVRRDDATSTLKKNTENSVTISDLTPWDPTTPNANTWSGNGLGFTVFHSTANKNSAWWGTGTTLTDSNNKYAGFNTTQSDIMRNSTYVSSSTATDIGYMLNVPPTQKSGAYSGSVTYQAVTTP